MIKHEKFLNKYAEICTNKIQKKGSQCVFLSVIFINSNYRKDKDYYSQVS